MQFDVITVVHQEKKKDMLDQALHFKLANNEGCEITQHLQ